MSEQTTWIEDSAMNESASPRKAELTEEEREVLRELEGIAPKATGLPLQSEALQPTEHRPISKTDPAPEQHFVVKELEGKAALFQQRHAVYGDNYKRFGPVMTMLLDGQALSTRSMRDMSRLGLFVQLVSKITRYGENFNRGGHADSLDDIAVYAMMLKEIDSK